MDNNRRLMLIERKRERFAILARFPTRLFYRGTWVRLVRNGR